LDAFDLGDAPVAVPSEQLLSQLSAPDPGAASRCTLTPVEKKSLRGFVINISNAIRLQVLLLFVTASFVTRSRCPVFLPALSCDSSFVLIKDGMNSCLSFGSVTPLFPSLSLTLSVGRRVDLSQAVTLSQQSLGMGFTIPTADMGSSISHLTSLLAGASLSSDDKRGIDHGSDYAKSLGFDMEMDWPEDEMETSSKKKKKNKKKVSQFFLSF
jgi:hypothetical protein